MVAVKIVSLHSSSPCYLVTTKHFLILSNSKRQMKTYSNGENIKNRGYFREKKESNYRLGFRVRVRVMVRLYI